MNLDHDKIARLTPWLLANIKSEDLDAKDMSDYVISLISSPGSQEQLFEKCTSELEEFLGNQTRPFVEALFAQIASLDRPPQELGQPEQPQEQATNTTENQPPELSGSQEQLRRNFRNDYTPQSNHQPRTNGRFMHQFQGQTFQPQFSPQPSFGQQHPFGQQTSFGQHPQFGQPPSQFGPQQPAQQFGQFTPNMQQNVLPPQFGFQGFGKPQRGGFQQRRGGYQKNGHFQRGPNKSHISHLSSIENELSVANRSLIVEKIPEEFLNKESIVGYFGKFGEVTNVNVMQDQQLAEIEFAGHDQALAAHKSPEPIFGNRFVKVFWRKKQDNDKEVELDVDAVRRMQAIKQQQWEEKENKRKEKTAQLKEIMSAQAEVLQKRQDLLKSGQSAPEIQQELLLNYEELSSKASQLKQELALTGGSASGNHAQYVRGGYRGRGSIPYQRGRGISGRGGFRSSIATASIDRRPKNIQLQGIGAEHDEALKSELASRHYIGFSRENDSTVTVAFSDRQSAEDFYKLDLPDFKDVKKQWVSYAPDSIDMTD